VAKICHIATKENVPSNWSRELLEKFPKKLSYFKEVGGVGQVSSFLLLKWPHLANK
jgi:hypothetical protein